MDEYFVKKIERIILQRKESHEYMLKSESKTYQAFNDVEKYAFATQSLTRKHKELIALGISICTNCESCMEWHLHQALEFGATVHEIHEAIDVSIEMGGGPATVAARFAIQVLQYYQSKSIRMITSEDIDECVSVIRASHETVARDFGLTKEIAPTHPAYMEKERVLVSMEKGARFFGYFVKKRMVGCLAVEKSDRSDLFFIERLSVLPENRHNKIGNILMEYAFRHIRSLGGLRVSIGIVNQNTQLKKWYADMGFIETSTRKFDHIPFDVCFMEMTLA